MSLAAAIEAWRALLGEAHVSSGGPPLDAVRRSTFPVSQSASAVLRPGSADEVRGCLRIASREGVRLHPVSGGRNWGLGSRVPPVDGTAVMDLARLDRIVAFDESMAWVTVEPGVTFAQLYAFLAARGSRLFVNSTGASPGSSVLANALLRGDGAGPLGDRWTHVCGLEVALGTGEVLRTGYARHPGSPLAPLHRHGVGPVLDGLFSQSSLGVVTRMTVWLTPLPASIQAVRFSCADDARLPGAIDALRALVLEGTVRWPAGIWNAVRVLSTLGPRGDLGALRAAHGLGHRWYGLTALAGATELQGRAHRERLVDVLGPAVDAWSIEERVGDAVSGAELLLPEEPAFRFLQGMPHEESVRSVYWCAGASPPSDLDPDRDGCGVLWLCPTVPLIGAAVRDAMLRLEAVMESYGFDPMLAGVAHGARAMHLAPLLLWDRAAPGRDAAAMACHAALVTAMEELGCLPYRVGIPPLDRVPTGDDDRDAVLARLRAALDPGRALG